MIRPVFNPLRGKRQPTVALLGVALVLYFGFLQVWLGVHLATEEHVYAAGFPEQSDDRTDESGHKPHDAADHQVNLLALDDIVPVVVVPLPVWTQRPAEPVSEPFSTERPRTSARTRGPPVSFLL